MLLCSIRDKLETINILLNILMDPEFALFLDETGSPKPNRKDACPYFGFGGVLVKRQDERVIRDRLDCFKSNWDMKSETLLHGSEIRARKRGFAWLGKCSEEEQERFFDELTNVITSLPIILTACVVDRQGYLNRYEAQYGTNTWEMMRSAFCIVVERAAKYIASEGGKLMVYFEKIGKKEDRIIKGYFNELRSKGSPFNPSTSDKYSPLDRNEYAQLLRGIEGLPKTRSELQVADLCLYPLARGKREPNNRAFQSLKSNRLLINDRIEESEIERLGIKYYCFDT